MNRGSGIRWVEGLLLSILVCGSASAQNDTTPGVRGSSPSPNYPKTTGSAGGGSGAGIAIGAGAAAAAAVTYWELRHHLSSITGCVQPSGDGSELVSEKDQKTYALLASNGIRPPLGERVEMKGKKTTQDGKSAFQVRKLARTFGSCSEIAFDPLPSDPTRQAPESSRSDGNTRDAARLLDEEGPQFASAFSMSRFDVAAFVKGNWPMVLYYELDRPGAVQVRVEAEGVQPLLLRLEAPDTSRHMEVMRIPARFGARTAAARYSVQVESAPYSTAPRLRVYGFGAGPRAVGSIHIDRLRFDPGDIRPEQHEEASYSFHARADFEKAAAEFLRVGLVNGEIMTVRANRDVIEDGIRRDASKSGNWNGEDRAKRISLGQHLLQVRAWESREPNGDGGDWVAAWSDNAVRVE
ncbi:MAG TPA: hypothetical protein VI455_07525 [Terriglobia bacterium]